MSIWTSIWKIGIPKDTLLHLIEAMDTDADGYITIGDVRDLLKRYGSDAKKSFKCFFRRK